MCGIAGIVMRDGSEPETAILDAFESALQHRGPDGSGRYVDGAVCLLQTRLAIIDLQSLLPILPRPPNTTITLFFNIF